MKTVFNYIVKPLNEKRYQNTLPVGDKELIVNTDNFDHRYVEIGLLKSLEYQLILKRQ